MNYFPTATLSETTKKAYNTYIGRWLSFGIPNLDSLIKDSGTAIELLKKAPVKQTVHVYHSYYSAIVAYITHEAPPSLKTFKGEWESLQRENHSSVDEHYEKQEPTERQMATLVEWDTVLKVRDELPSSIEKLLLGFYTYIPPVRADYYATVLIHVSDPVPKEENYIILGDTYKLVIQTFKTGKTYKTIEHILPIPLQDLMKESLKIEPRNYLFIKRRLTKKDPCIPMTPAEYTSWANRILSRIFNKNTNLTALRHAFVSTINYNQPLSTLKKITNAMGHSVEMSMKYIQRNKSTD
jgi:hypothetical protein